VRRREVIERGEDEVGSRVELILPAHSDCESHRLMPEALNAPKDKYNLSLAVARFGLRYIQHLVSKEGTAGKTLDCHTS
jgi:hypothetical protein